MTAAWFKNKYAAVFQAADLLKQTFFITCIGISHFGSHDYWKYWLMPTHKDKNVVARVMQCPFQRRQLL